jgi:hypothetical protein
MRDQEIIGLWEAYNLVYEQETGRGPRISDTYDMRDAEGGPKGGRTIKGPKKKNVIRKEEVDLYDIILSYLLDEGFASDEKSAEAILGAMSEAWVESISESLLGNFEAKKREQSGYKGPAPSINTSPGYRTPIEVQNDIEPGMRHLLRQAKNKSTNDIKTA